jgi:RNA polymerase sigma factor (sigma-70 family)
MRVVNDDHALWQSFKEGNKDSFQTIYFSYFNHLYEYGMRLAGDKEKVKDCIHDLFVKLWNNKSNLSDITAIRPYLLVSLRTTLFNKLQKESRVVPTEINEHHPFEMVFSVESDFIKKETRSGQVQKLIEALNQLTPRQKEVIYLRYFEEMEYEEIAAMMNITVKATYKLTARGLETLRHVMNISNSSLLLLLTLAPAELFC